MQLRENLIAAIALIATAVVSVSATDYHIEYEEGNYDAERNTFSLQFSNAVNLLEIYPYGACKSKGGEEASMVDTAGLKFVSTPNVDNPKIEIVSDALGNDAIHTVTKVDGVRTDIINFCVYAATTTDTGAEVGFAEVPISVEYVASGVVSTSEVTVLPLIFKTCDDSTVIAQGFKQPFCVGIANPEINRQFRVNQIKSCRFEMDLEETHASIDLAQDAILENEAVDELTLYDYASQCSNNQGEACSTLEFRTELISEFFILGGGRRPVTLTCTVEAASLQEGTRHLKEISLTEETVVLELQLEGNEEEIDLVLLGAIAGAAVVLCLSVIGTCYYCWSCRHASTDDDDDEGSIDGVPAVAGKDRQDETESTFNNSFGNSSGSSLNNSFSLSEDDICVHL